MGYQIPSRISTNEMTAETALWKQAVDVVKSGKEAVVVSSTLVQKGEGYKLKEAATRIKPLDGYTDVVVHGSEDAFEVMHNGNWISINQRLMANYLKNNPEYAGGAIRLISCSTGAKPNGIAQQLANKMGVNVLAPSNTLYIHPNGNMTIGNDAFSNMGTWNLFVSGKH